MRKRIITYIIATMCCFAAMAQNRLDSIAMRALQVGRVMQQERVFLHFDNTAYYLGETMWFKAYVSFGNNDRPSTLSKVLYVELVAPEGYVVETKKYKINDDGSCYGEFELNPMLLSGYYEIRAYTRYMLNWDESSVFSRVFPIFDKVNADNWDFKNMLDRRRGYTENGKWVSSELPGATLQFFPEGGNLVAGLESKVAFELRENDGLFSEEEITIYEDGKKLLSCRPQHMGKGTFTFIPKQDTGYKAVTTVKDSEGKRKEYTFDLPVVNSEGAVMKVTELSDSVVISISNNYAHETEIAFAILHRGALGYYKKFSSNDKAIEYRLHKNELPEGVNRALIFIDETLPLAERQFFVTHNELKTGDRSTARLHVTANGYHTHNLNATPGEKITIRVAREDGKALSPESDLSLSISDALGTQATSYSHNLYTYLLLGSELKGYIPNAAQYFDTDNSDRKAQLDLVMLTHGWTSYNWSLLTRSEIKDIQPIERGITIKGQFFQKYRSNSTGSNRIRLTPQKDNLVRLDVSIDGSQVTTSTFRTDSTGSFILELEDFYGSRIASLRPQTTFKHSQNIKYQFALDRYYSPGFRLYDYWERNLGNVMSSSASDSLVRLSPFEYMLSSLEVVADRKKDVNARPPHSEMRFNYLDEWEYAQDVTYLNQFGTYEDQVFNDFKEDMNTFEEENTRAMENLINEAVENDEIISVVIPIDSNSVDRNIEIIKYMGSLRLSNEARTLTVDHEFDHTLTANDVVLSAMRRHNYNWAYWVQLMVVLGEYSPYSTPQPDKEYLRGLPDVEKMTNFKEFVIRSDEKTRQQFENRDNCWTPLGRMMDNKIPVQKFYKGFLSQSYLLTGEGVDDCPNSRTFFSLIDRYNGISYPMNPNYVACLIPYTAEERSQGIVPEYAATGSSMRYTAVQGYSQSKKFYSPDYSNIQPDDKDYRRTLLWEPEVKIENGEAVIEFYNSSCCTNINVSVNGRDGRTLYSNDAITVTRELIEETRDEASQQNVSDTDKEDEMTPEMERACAAEHRKGLLYYNQQRYKDAITVFAELVQYKYAPSIYYIGLCYRDGTGLKKNPELAYQFLKNAADRGLPEAKFELARFIESGEVERDDELAQMLYTEAADADEPRALTEIAHRYRDGMMTEKDTVMYRNCIQRAAELQYPEAMFEYGQMLNREGGNGFNYIKSAAELKNADAMLYIIELEDKAGNYSVAYSYAKELSGMGNHQGTKIMADYYYHGKGVSRDRGLAKDLYRDAANAGNQEAARILEEL